MTVTLDTADLKQLIKDAFIELMVEHREEFQDLMLEVLEDAPMSKAIMEGKNSSEIDKETFFHLLECKE